jgi:GxxExxY protein
MRGRRIEDSHTKVTKEHDGMSENEIAKRVLDAAFVVHTKLGSGLLESVYEVVLAHELRKDGMPVERQKPMPITYDGILFEEGYRADLLVASKVIVELKSVATLSAVHPKQVLTQLRLSGLKLGLLINFGEAHLKNGIKRIINGHLEEESSPDISL